MILIKGAAFTVRYKTLGKNIIQITLSHLASCHFLSQLPIIKKKMNKLFPVHIPKHQIIMWMFVIGFSDNWLRGFADSLNRKHAHPFLLLFQAAEAHAQGLF